jgi:hypothetical protein
MSDSRRRSRPVLINGCEVVLAFALVTGIRCGASGEPNGTIESWATDGQLVPVGRRALARFAEQRECRRIAPAGRA